LFNVLETLIPAAQFKGVKLGKTPVTETNVNKTQSSVICF